jgi:hypothetical protein
VPLELPRHGLTRGFGREGSVQSIGTTQGGARF